MNQGKPQILWSEYQTTQVIKGSKIAFFFCFWLTKILNRAQRLNNFCYTIVKAVTTLLPKTDFVIKNKRGIFLIQAFDDSLTICADYFEKELQPWLSIPTSHDIFIDIGANRGIYTLLALRDFSYSFVHAFEPNPQVALVLSENLKLNNFTSKAIVHTAALGSSIKTLPFNVDSLHKGGGHISKVGTENTTMLVDMLTLDSTLTTDEQSRISFIKIDTEGYEREVLGGMKNTLTTMTRGSCLMIETSELDEIADIVAKFGFIQSSHSHNDHLFIKNGKT